MPRNQYLMRYGPCTCYMCITFSLWSPCISTKLSALGLTEVPTLMTTHCFTRTSWQVFSTRCCDISKSFIGSEYNEVTRCPHNRICIGLRSDDCVGQVTGSPRPNYSSPKAWSRFSLTLLRKLGGAPRVWSLMKVHSS